MNQQISYLVTPTTINIMLGNTHKSVIIKSKEQRNTVIKALEYASELPFEEGLYYLDEFLNPSKRIILNSDNRFEYNENKTCLFLKGSDRPIPEMLATRLLEFLNEELPINSLVKFWENCLANPEYRAIEELYGFLEHNGHPITQDGYFIAYKKVANHSDNEMNDRFNGAYLMHTGQLRLGNGQFGNNQDKEEFLRGASSTKLVDNYTHRINNNIGQVVSIPRQQVDKDRNVTCSHGLHVANWEYAKTYSGTVLISVKVNPKNVVSVPVDYNNMKMRVCEYTVMGIIDEQFEEKHLDV